jgi:hypothetical protein
LTETGAPEPYEAPAVQAIDTRGGPMSAAATVVPTELD